MALLLALSVLLSAAACSDDDPLADGGKDPNGPTSDIVDKVSQYEARKFDGQKRGDVFYEIYVRSFADSDGDGIGDLRGVTSKLDYLDDLGVAGIWLMPIYATGSEHGYDVVDYREVCRDYGSMEDMEQLIDEAHKRKIRVILDFVPNHTSQRCQWFREACLSTDNPYRGFYHFSTTKYDRWYPVTKGTTSYFYQGEFDRSMPDLNYGPAATCASSPTFKAMTDAAKFWIDKGVDGFRLDAVKHIYNNSTSDENPTFLNRFYTEINRYFQGRSALGFKEVYMVGECWMQTEQVAPYYKGLPALFDFDFWDKYLLYAIQNSHAKWFPKDMIDTERAFAAYRTDFIQASKLSNHDQNRTRSAIGGSEALSLQKAKIAAAVLLTASGSPYIYYGEEIGMLGDKARSDNGNTGDRNVRTPMLWAPSANDRVRPTWIKSVVNNDISVGSVKSQADNEKSIYNVYRKFLRLRNTYPALAQGYITLPEDFDVADAKNKQVMAFCRRAGEERLLVIHNVADHPSTYTINHAIKQPIADMNRVTVKRIDDMRHEVELPAYSSIIIEL